MLMHSVYSLWSSVLVEDHYLDKRKISGSGDNFFNSVESGVAQIVRKDKLQEEYQKVRNKQ